MAAEETYQRQLAKTLGIKGKAAQQFVRPKAAAGACFSPLLIFWSTSVCDCASSAIDARFLYQNAHILSLASLQWLGTTMCFLTGRTLSCANDNPMNVGCVACRMLPCQMQYIWFLAEAYRSIAV